MDDKEKMLNILEELSKADYEKYLYLLDNFIPGGRLDDISRVKLATLLQQYFPNKVLDITAYILQKIPRKDLLKRFHLKPDFGENGTLPKQDQEKTMQTKLTSSPEKRAILPESNPTGVPESKPTGTSMPLVTDQQLMLLAGNFGKEWKIIGIQFLGIQCFKLEQIEEENNFSVQMRVFQMLKTWRTQVKKEATATRLHEILSQEDVPLHPEAIHFLVKQE
ncbi:uncharacterized protein LOC115466730 [Microcaecilia unicolor]|uniref:Uncharacterized protein LOC115466730 n=1 Tax=Microcaecilia unicolor TaxID=1415580 RepID=A0A6P7XUA9_9AMPH|nr:uncharacterized protein LOC115466730 [Microcaecilia unicolor]XP_030054048.1 uncharacterized protein LOC115466730 [Microcaecilia unicolor]XP_030054049.1 uncharacterized protein LOC115466730 [Microcaecilia unicolor]